MPRSALAPHTTTAHALAADPLLQALRRALPVGLNEQALTRLTDKGLAHDHVRISGSGLLARIPKQSQMQLNAADNLAYQRACFDRAAEGHHAPQCHGVLPPSVHLPRGALLVQEIIGRPADLPRDLKAIVQSLAALHDLPLPATEKRAPLWNAPDPLQALADEVSAQAKYLHEPHVSLAFNTRQAIATGLEALHALCVAPARPSRHLIAFDGHPGNFVVQTDGKAMLVDLEKCRYSYPGLDLAHATLYTSTTWDVDTHAVLSLDQVAQAYADWDHVLGQHNATARAWHVPLRRAMWLWSITWCVKWQALSGRAATTGGDGEDWSAEHSTPALVSHVQERVSHFLSEDVVAQCLGEFKALESL